MHLSQRRGFEPPPPPPPPPGYATGFNMNAVVENVVRLKIAVYSAGGRAEKIEQHWRLKLYCITLGYPSHNSHMAAGVCGVGSSFCEG